MKKTERVLIDMPQFKFYGHNYAELTKVHKVKTPIKGHIASIPHVLLADDGKLMVTSGFVYDFGSGPALNTPAMIYASLAHDCFYLLMQAGELPWERRKDVDKYFREQLKYAGMPWIRRQWCYWGVRIGYPIWSAFVGEQRGQ